MKPVGAIDTLKPAKQIDMLRVIYTEKVPPYNPGEEATWPAGDARRLVIAGVAQPFGFPREPFPTEGGPTWSLSRTEEENRRSLNVYREHTKSDEEILNEQARKEEVERVEAERTGEQDADDDEVDTESPSTDPAERSFLAAEKADKKTAKKSSRRGKGGRK